MARALILLSMLFIAAAAQAAGEESLPDPTLPPATELLNVKGSDGSASSAPVLHAIITRQGMPPAAVIGDQVVQVGSRFGEAKLVKVGTSEVVLLGPNGRQTLQLVPGVVKTMSDDKKTRARRGREK